MRKNYKYGFYVCLGFTVIVVLSLCCYWTRVKEVNAVLETAALFIMDVWESILIAPVFFVINVLFFVWWVWTYCYLYSTGELDTSNRYPFG